MSSQSKRELRRDPRVRAELEIELRSPEGDEAYVTQNVSFRGVYIVCESPLPLRTLVRVKVWLTPKEGGQAPVEMLGLVAHRITMQEATTLGEAPGMGVQLFAAGEDQRSRWLSFIHERIEQDPRASRELAQRLQPHVKLSFSSPDQLRSAAKTHFSSGEVFVHSNVLHKEGSEVWFETQHPKTKNIFRVPAHVLDLVERPKQNRGMVLRFEDGAALSAALINFLEQGKQVD